jgi:hypothetical protein
MAEDCKETCNAIYAHDGISFVDGTYTKGRAEKGAGPGRYLFTFPAGFDMRLYKIEGNPYPAEANWTVTVDDRNPPELGILTEESSTPKDHGYEWVATRKHPQPR